MSRTGMVGMGVGDQGALDRPPGVDEKAARRAVQTLRRERQQCIQRHINCRAQ